MGKLTLLVALALLAIPLGLSHSYLSPELSAQPPADQATLRYYAGQTELFSLKQLPAATVGRRMRLQGKADYRYVMIQIKSPKDEGVVHLHPKKSDGSFDVDVLFSRGKGKHRLTFFGSNEAVGRLDGIAYLEITVKDSFRPTDRELSLGKQIASFLKSQKGQSMGRGECWDAAQMALDRHGAYWKRTFDYGRPLKAGAKIEPGDIIQFRELRLEEKGVDEQGRKFTRRYNIGNPDHTSIVLKVLGKGRYLVTHQNVNGIRSMLIEELNLSFKRLGGSFDVYRPTAGLAYRHRKPASDP